MKKIFTLIMVASLSLIAVAQTAATNKAQAMKSLMAREHLSNTIASLQTPAQPSDAVAKTEEVDTTELIFKEFYEDPLYYPVKTEVSRNGDTIVTGGDWIIVLKNDHFKFTFDVYNQNPNSPAGTYTKEDLDEWFSTCSHPGAEGKTCYYKTCNLQIQEFGMGGGVYLYILDAEIVATVGLGDDKPVSGIFKIHAEHQVLKAEVSYDVAILDCVVEPEEDHFRIYGKNDTMDVDLTFYTQDGVVGYYTHKMLDLDESKLIHRGKSYEISQLEGLVTTQPTIDGGVAYVFMFEALTTDAYFYNVAMEAPVKATDTISIRCNNLYVDASLGMQQGTITLSASNDQYDIYAGYNDMMVRDSATYNGDKALVYIKELASGKTVSGFLNTITIVGNRTKGYFAKMDVLGSDHKYYDIYVTNIISDYKDTVILDFPTISKAAYYIDEIVDNMDELQLANYNDDYSVAFDILYINQIMGTEFDKNNLFLEQSYLVKHTPAGDEPVEMLQVKGEIYQEKDTTFLKATVVGLDSVLYHISMFYTIPTPTETVSYTFTKDNTFLTNALPQNVFILEGMTEDGNVMSMVRVNRTSNLEGTFVNDGKFEKNDFAPFETYVAVYNPTIDDYEHFFLQKGEMTVTIDEDNMLHATCSFICDDSKLYQLTFDVKYERPHLPFDAEGEGVEYTYDENAVIFTKDYVETHNMMFFDILPADYSNVASLCFIIDHTDSEITIPEGVYPIQNLSTPATVGTVVASRGLGSEDGMPLQSYFSELEVDGSYKEGRGYFLVDGTVTVKKVDGKLQLDIDAVNSYDLPVKLHYLGDGTDVENVESNSTNTIQKCFIDGQLLIIRNNEVYTITGVRLK